MSFLEQSINPGTAIRSGIRSGISIGERNWRTSELYVAQTAAPWINQGKTQALPMVNAVSETTMSGMFPNDITQIMMFVCRRPDTVFFSMAG